MEPRDEDRWAEQNLREMLAAAGIEPKGSYSPREVRQLLNLNPSAFERVVNRYRVDGETGKPVRPDALDSFRLGAQRRVPHGELIRFLSRNRGCVRRREATATETA